MNIPRPYPRRRARIEIIPLIDIIFFLLATFVVVSMSMVKNDGVTVDLPQASTATKQDSQNTITLTVKENGDIYFNKNVVSIEQLSIALEKVKGDPTMAIIIRTLMITRIHMLRMHHTIKAHTQSRWPVAGPSWQATVFTALEMVS